MSRTELQPRVTDSTGWLGFLADGFELSAPNLSLATPGQSDSKVPGTNDDSNPDIRKPARILIADDHEAVRRGLRSALLGAGWQVCGEAINGKDAIEKAEELKPDLIVLDVSMPIMGGLEAAPQILKFDSHAKLVAFTMHESQQLRNEMARIGVHAVAVKSAPLARLLETIRTVLEERAS